MIVGSKEGRKGEFQLNYSPAEPRLEGIAEFGKPKLLST